MLSLVVMAAGLGSRYGGSKQSDKMGPDGEILLDYAVYDALAAGFSRLVLVIAPGMENSFGQSVIDRYKGRLAVSLAVQKIDDLPDGFVAPVERKKPWGTGHAVLAARHFVKGPFCVINADDYYGQAAYREMADFLASADPGASPSPYSMVGFGLENTLSENGAVSRGVCVADEAGCLASIEEHEKIEARNDGQILCEDCSGKPKSLSKNAIVSLNFWGFMPDVFERLNNSFAAFLKKSAGSISAEFYLPFAVDSMIKKGRARVTVLKSPDRWVGVTYKEDSKTVSDHLAKLASQGLYPRPLWQGRS
ncbi:MAG: nucleotidyltransferase [Desulfatibacillaceae bacterium]|nr:nucleotidyltransferase [Desulfatibacillaceae bacterium]